MKPREKLLRFGPHVLENKELLAILLRTGTDKKGVLDLSKEILESFPSITSLAEATVEEILSIKGVGIAKAASLKAALEIGKRLHLEMVKKPKRIKSVEDLLPFCEDLKFQDGEVLRIIAVDGNLSYISQKDFYGSSSAVYVEIKDVMRYLLRVNASAFFISHNHKSSLNPSEEDKKYTLRLLHAGDILGIKLLDHVIVTSRGYYSFSKKGLI